MRSSHCGPVGRERLRLNSPSPVSVSKWVCLNVSCTSLGGAELMLRSTMPVREVPETS